MEEEKKGGGEVKDREGSGRQAKGCSRKESGSERMEKERLGIVRGEMVEGKGGGGMEEGGTKMEEEIRRDKERGRDVGEGRS